MRSFNLIISLLFIFFTILTSFDYKVTKQYVQRPFNHTLQYYLSDLEGNLLSSWADIDIQFNYDTINAVIQIPKQSSAKYQMIKQAPDHPIMQDFRTNKNNNKLQLRHYAIPLPYINYGFVPMTWQQTITPDKDGFYGDDDPIDILDMSTQDRKLLDIIKVKILGAFCLIDQGQLDWKVFVMDVDEAEQKNINTWQDLPKERVEQIMYWFKIYKTYDGKPQNVIGYGQKIFSKQEAIQIVFETHVQFLRLKKGGGAYQAKKQEFNL